MWAVLQGLSVPRRAAVQEAYAAALTYFTNHKERMNYPYYLSQGWQIGSGPVESANARPTPPMSIAKTSARTML